ncbi:hypothetical protein DK847_00345 [Aestuariivirga litoralis]|uniref:CobQ/CobB/MinD/ParA nucleotide binding domain-containing protein n=1 Tax=Aestuariivirga litoralis TaxID=2650924 RepID=A0A2W2CDI9_9HYPH|nr:hypothetical protein [Aestuariivirga litoralis]PZF78313.1 hypothetical protein DK847_00345 [Aestuariivirga litoralis]
MPAPPTIYIVCSDRGRNGKTLLARILVDHLLIAERDPFCFDLSAPEGALRAYFPGRTALIDMHEAKGREKLFDILLSRAGRDYVIDVPSAQLARFLEAAGEARLHEEAAARGFRLCVLFVVDRDPASLKTAVALEEMLQPDMLVPVVNRFVGTSLPEGVPGPVVMLDKIEGELRVIISHRRFSLRSFLLGDEQEVPARLRPQLKNVLHGVIDGLRNIEPAMSLQSLHGADL